MENYIIVLLFQRSHNHQIYSQMLKNLKDQSGEKKISQTVLPSYIVKPLNMFEAGQNDPVKEEHNNNNNDEFSALIKGKKLNEPIKSYIHKQISQKELNKESRDLMHRKNIYRSRKQKKSVLRRPKISVKTKLTDNPTLIYFFRNQIISLITLLAKREQYLNILRGKRIQLGMVPLRQFEIEEKLQKQIKNKGKDKGRKNFNQLTNEQLRSLKYKPRSLPLSKKDGKGKNQDQILLQESDAQYEEQEEDYPDLATWKRKNGVSQNQKVFIIKGGYHQLRKTLIDKGWAENQDVWSRFFDFKWTTKACDINYAELKNGQMVNHFNNNHHLTSKYGLTRRLRTLIISNNIDVDRFYPRCFDLGDQVDVQNFVQNFKFSFAESVAKRFLLEKQRYKGLQLKIRTIASILERRVMSLAEKINMINNGNFPVISCEEWTIITETDEYTNEDKRTMLELTFKKDKFQSEETAFELLHIKIESILEKISSNEPQMFINGYRNVWIAKPNFLSRGRGIKCFNNLYDIADYCFGRETQFVIQKYIEKPMLIQGRKFDIRQWVLIQDYNPPKIFFYEDCYLRFCMDDYSLENIQNRFIHLTNNQIQKFNKKKPIEESIWEMNKFIEEVGKQKWNQIQQKIKNIVVWSIKSCQGYVTPKKGSYEMVGFDFMIDEQFNPWIIEINMSPSMEANTNVLKRLTKNVLRDTGLIVANSKFKPKVGGYTCIYQGQEDLDKFQLYCQNKK